MYHTPHRSFTLATAACAVLAATAQDFQERSKALLAARDFYMHEVLLGEWEMADSSDAELHVAAFNHWVNRARQQVVRLDTKPTGDHYLMLTEPDGDGSPVGFLGDGVYYEPTLLAKGFAAVERGIVQHPQRLDLRFGRIHMLGESEDWEGYTDAVIATIAHGEATGHAWTWTAHEPVEDAREFCYNNVQAYVYRLFSADDDDLLPLMARIAETVLTHRPDHVESLSTLASVHIMQNRLEEGVALLLKAERLAPEDAIVLGNIAEAYARLGEKKKALTYFRRVEKVGGPQLQDHARRRIAELGR